MKAISQKTEIKSRHNVYNFCNFCVKFLSKKYKKYEEEFMKSAKVFAFVSSLIVISFGMTTCGDSGGGGTPPVSQNVVQTASGTI